MPRRVPLAKFLDQIIPQTDPRTGVIQADAPHFPQTRTQSLHLLGRGRPVHFQHFDRLLHIARLAQRPGHRQIVPPSEINAHDQG